jgi:charged multivesicular body protein 4
MPFNLFGKSEAKVDPMEAITKLNDSTEMLEKKSAHLEKQIEKELQSAKTYGTKNKRMALGALKRKKRFEAQLKLW